MPRRTGWLAHPEQQPSVWPPEGTPSKHCQLSFGKADGMPTGYTAGLHDSVKAVEGLLPMLEASKRHQHLKGRNCGFPSPHVLLIGTDYEDDSEVVRRGRCQMP